MDGVSLQAFLLLTARQLCAVDKEIEESKRSIDRNQTIAIKDLIQLHDHMSFSMLKSSSVFVSLMSYVQDREQEIADQRTRIRDLEAQVLQLTGMLREMNRATELVRSKPIGLRRLIEWIVSSKN